MYLNAFECMTDIEFIVGLAERTNISAVTVIIAATGTGTSVPCYLNPFQCIEDIMLIVWLAERTKISVVTGNSCHRSSSRGVVSISYPEP